MTLPHNDNRQPSQKPGFRPSRANTMLAGIEAHIIASIWIAIGRVMSVLFTASDSPISEAMTTWPAIMAFSSA